MKSSRRHDSLIPLSREHQYALLVCLRLHRGLPEHRHDNDWVRAKAEQVTQFFERDLTAHFRAEEEILFPAMQSFSSASEIISELLSEHRQLKIMIERLRNLDGESLAVGLNEFADLLEAHIRKEERQLFPRYEAEVSAETAQRIEQEIVARIGTARHPNHPELLS